MVDEGRALGVEIVKALAHIVQDVESITQTSLWIALDKLSSRMYFLFSCRCLLPLLFHN